jgi:predicted RNA-binding protein associated with RNAse of E/G family
MHPVREYAYFPSQRLCVHVQGGETETPEHLYDTPYGLSYGVAFTEEQHPKLSSRESQVLPALGLEVSRFAYRRRAFWRGFDYYVDIARVSERGDRWVVRDLYLDVLVYEGKRAEIVDTDEYLAAVKEGHLSAEEAAYALFAAHKLLNGLAEQDYSLEGWLRAQGVTLTWRALAGTGVADVLV